MRHPPTSKPPKLLLLATACLAALLASRSCTATPVADGSPAYRDMQAGGLHDPRFKPGLARFYIPDNIPDLWTHDHEQPPLEFSEAYGHYVQGPGGLQFYDSHWIRLFYQWVYQLKRSPLRVHSADAADFVFVPVCLGGWCGGRPSSPLYFHSPVYRWSHNKEDRRRFFFSEAPKWLPLLGKKPHVIVYNGALTNELTKFPGAGNYTFIGLETPPFLDATRFMTVPYPSHEHHDVNEPAPSIDSLVKQKTNLAVGIYVVRKALSDGVSGKLGTRLRLHEACTKHNKTCTHIVWEQTHNISQQASAYSNYASHWYCLQPPGDWVLRGAMYDCAVAGGIPYVFRPDYKDYVAFADMFDYSKMLVQAPTGAQLNKTDYIAHLEQLHKASNSTATLAAWQQVRRVFTYALNPDHYLVSWKDRSTLHPRDDAFTFGMKALLRTLCKQPGMKNSAQCSQPTAAAAASNNSTVASNSTQALLPS